MAQLQKRVTDTQVTEMLKRDLNREIEGAHLQAVLGVGKTPFFRLLTRYRMNPATCSIQYQRKVPTRRLDPGIERNLLKELTIDQHAIQSPQLPLRS